MWHWIIVAVLTIGVAEGSGDWVTAHGGTIAKDAAGNVTEVSLRASWVTDGDLARLAGFPNLRRLDLSRTHINDRSLEPLKQLAHLADLDLTYAEHITDAGLARLRGIRSLERLALEGTKITDSGMNSIAALVNLRSLNIRSTQITDSALEQLETLSKLEELAIGGNRIAGFGLVYLQGLPKLKHLDLSGAQLTDDGIWSVGLTDLNIEVLSAQAQLESLNLGGSQLLGLGVVGDGGERELTTIKVTDLGLGKLRSLRNLRSLDITRARITGRGLESLASLPNLERLVLAHTEGLDDTARPALMGMKQLKVVDLSGVKMSVEGLTADVIRSAR